MHTPIANDMKEVFEILDSLRLPHPRGVLQVGANTGQEVPYFVKHGVRYAAMIEPLEEPLAELAERCRDLPGYLPVRALCSSRDGQMVDFHISSNFGESSSILKPANHLTDYPWVQFPTIARMESFTLDRVFGAITSHHPDIAAAIGLLFMDVQGAELEVLKGANSVLHQVSYIYTEVGIGGGYEGAVELIDLMNYLRVYGFKAYELSLNAEGWGNAFFVKKAPPQPAAP